MDDFDVVAINMQDWEEGDGDFVAPELLRPEAHAESSADIFSFGATLYELSTGKSWTIVKQLLQIED